MPKYVIVSASVDLELAEKLRKYNIEPSKIIKEALKKEVEKREAEEVLMARARAGLPIDDA